MKRLSFYIGLVLFVMIGFGVTGCYKDVISPESDPDGTPQNVSFKEDIAPILEVKCATAGCHVNGGKKPYLSQDVSYQSLTNGGYVNTVVPKASKLYQAVYGIMSEYIPSPKDKQKVYDWIRNGAPNN